MTFSTALLLCFLPFVHGIVPEPLNLFALKDAELKKIAIFDTDIPPLNLTGGQQAKILVRPKLSITTLGLVDEKRNLITVNGAFEMVWLAEPLGFLNRPGVDVSEFPIVDASKRIWYPKIAILNMANAQDMGQNLEKVPFAIQTYAVYKYRTMGSYRTYANFILSCNFRLVAWPFDTQRCSFNMRFIAEESYTFFDPEIRFPICKMMFTENSQWEFLGSRNDYIRMPDGDEEMVIEFVIRRKSSYYVVTLVVPVVTLSVTGILTFLVPPRSDEKMSISTSILIAFFLIFGNCVNQMPPTSELPLFVWYMFALFCCSTYACVWSALLLRSSENVAKEIPFLALIQPIYFFRYKLSCWKPDTIGTSTKKHDVHIRRIRALNNLGVTVYLLSVVIITVAVVVRLFVEYRAMTPDLTATGSNNSFALDGKFYFKTNDNMYQCYNCKINSNGTDFVCV